MHATFDPFGVIDGLHTVGRRRKNVRSMHRLARIVHCADLDVEAARHLLGVAFTVGRRWAVDFAQADIPDGLERLEERARHAAGSLSFPKIQIRTYWWCSPPRMGMATILT